MTRPASEWSPTVIRITAVASMLSAFTTLILIFAPSLYPAPAGIEDRVTLLGNGWYRLHRWTYFGHPFLVFAAATGVWRFARRTDAGLAAFGLVGFAVWAYTEALQQALSLVAVAWNWVAAWPSADVAGRTAIAERVDMFFGLWDGLYLLLLTGFVIGNLFMGLALRRGADADRRIGGLLLAVALLGIGNLVAGYGGPAWVGSVLTYAYPATQPAIRLATGVWLWRRASAAG